MNIGVALVIGDEGTLSGEQMASLESAGIAVERSDELPPHAESSEVPPYDVVLAGVPEQPSDAVHRVDDLLALEIPLILLTDERNLADAYAIAGETAFDCLPRNVSGAWLTHKVHQALRQKHAQEGATHAPPRNSDVSLLAGVKGNATLAGQGSAMQRIRRQIAEAARANMPVMIHGETGTGKDVVARLIHEAARAARPGAFVKVACPAFPGFLLDDELFGGTAIGGKSAKPGRIALAARGTLLLDEISEMSASTQARLLDVLEPERSDLRIVATSSASPDRIFSSGAFRRDLYFRLNGYTIELPALREHPEDIPALVEFFLAKYAELFNSQPPAAPPSVLARMTHYGWPGNVRELEVAVKRFVVSGHESALTSTFISPEEPIGAEGAGDRYHESERRVILSALAETRWNRRKAAKLLGISYNTLRRRIQRYHLDAHSAN